ncbi:MAG: hypothetical protein MJA29_02815, partial [Candidatus Omnitrophica bacterium]|nr:hypothetical protein [Candidatus Omnitrophota bacterium]
PQGQRNQRFRGTRFKSNGKPQDQTNLIHEDDETMMALISELCEHDGFTTENMYEMVETDEDEDQSND